MLVLKYFLYVGLALAGLLIVVGPMVSPPEHHAVPVSSVGASLRAIADHGEKVSAADVRRALAEARRQRAEAAAGDATAVALSGQPLSAAADALGPRAEIARKPAIGARLPAAPGPKSPPSKT